MLPIHADLADMHAMPLPEAPVTTYQWPTAVRRPPLGWRLRQLLLLALNGSFLVPLWAWLARRLGLAVVYGELRGVVFHADGTATDYGLLSRKVVTTAGVNYLSGCFDGSNSVTVFKFHGYGTGTTAEATTDTALVTEFTTQYATANTRPTGSQAHATNVYTTVATFSPGSGGTLAVTECGLFSQAANSGGTLWDRFKFSAVNLVAGSDSLQSSITATFPSGG